MAQQLQDQKDDKCAEGKVIDYDEKNTSKFGSYRCVFRRVDDSLYVLMKCTKSKRSFTNTFSKPALTEMDLKQSVDKIINMLETAKSDAKSELSFRIGFYDANIEKKVSFSQLSKAYSKGNALYISILFEQSWFSAEYNFKLLEQKRNEIDILRDIIADMQEEIDELKTKTVSSCVAMWYHTGATSGNIALDGVHLVSTLDEMATLTNDKKAIIIGLTGLYRVTVVLNWTTHNAGGASRYFRINVNGTTQTQQFSGSTAGFGTIDRILKLNKADKLSFYFDGSSKYITNKNFNSFTLHKLS